MKTISSSMRFETCFSPQYTALLSLYWSEDWTCLGIHAWRSTARESIDRQNVSTQLDWSASWNQFQALICVSSRHIPTCIVQGRYDVVCPVRLHSFFFHRHHHLSFFFKKKKERHWFVYKATTAYALKKVCNGEKKLTLCAMIFSTKKQAFPEATFHIVPDAGHSSREPGTTKLLVEVSIIRMSLLIFTNYDWRWCFKATNKFADIWRDVMAFQAIFISLIYSIAFFCSLALYKREPSILVSDTQTLRLLYGHAKYSADHASLSLSLSLSSSFL